MDSRDGKSAKSHPKSDNSTITTSERQSHPCLDHLLTDPFVNHSLRTSETNYLNEAYSFYSAIRARGYYNKASKEERADLMVKKLRYFARFIVVCLLLKKMKLVRDLVRVSLSSFREIRK